MLSVKTVLILLLLHSTTYGDVIITIKDGQIRGSAIQMMNKTIHTFLGIRYAEPPIGSLRFAKPVPAKSWTGIYNATKYHHMCMQNREPQKESEDCLFIHVATPVVDNHSNVLKPVMFWIHGGGFHSGHGSLSTPLAAHDVVVVAFNYRLGPFGFLYGDSNEAPGNVGFWDMEMALKWVKVNIKSFGGNPEDITIFGQSAGGWSVGHLITSPITRNMFKKAILQSGSSYYYTGIGTAHKSLNLHDSKQLSKDMGCHDENKWLKCLKEIDAKKILTFNQSLYVNRPITGDEFMPETSQKALKSGHFNVGMPIMAGIVSNEGSTYGASVIPKFHDPHYHVTKESLKEQMKKLNKHLYKRLTPHVDADKVYDFYIKNIPESDQISLKRAFSQIFGDFILACPAYLFADDYALYSNKDNVFFYEFTYKSNHSSTCKDDWMGVCHAEDMPFTFGYPFSTEKGLYSKLDYQFSSLVMHLWTTFAKTGNPLSHSIPFPKDANLLGINLMNVKWSHLRSTHEEKVSKTMILDPKMFGTMVNNLFRSNCEEFWKPYFL